MLKHGESAPRNTLNRLRTLSQVARELVTARGSSWHFFNRLAFSACSKADCVHGYPHPVGRTLSMQTQALLQGCRSLLREREQRVRA